MATFILCITNEKIKGFYLFENVRYCLTFSVFLAIWLYPFIFIKNEVLDMEDRKECLISEWKSCVFVVIYCCFISE